MSLKSLGSTAAAAAAQGSETAEGAAPAEQFPGTPESPTPVEAVRDDADSVWFSVSPWKNFTYGRWSFKDGVMQLTEAEAVLFRKDILGLDSPTQHQIKEISGKAGVDLVRAHQAAIQGMQGTESGAAMQKLQAANPRVGTEQIG